jgi:hypothetical protein
MGTYATVALILAFLYYVSMRGDMKLYKDKQGLQMTLKPTNFHPETSVARPDKGTYVTPNLNNVYNN